MRNKMKLEAGRRGKRYSSMCVVNVNGCINWLLNFKNRKGGYKILKKPIIYYSGMFSCLLVLLMFTFSGCGKQENEEFPKKITSTLIAQGELHGNGNEGILQQNIIITTSTEWHSLINKMKSRNDNITDNFTEMEIDFTQYQVIAVFDEIKGNGGWSIDITDITEYADSIVVTYKNIETGNDTRVITQPFQIVKIPISSKNVIFPYHVYHDGKVPYQPCPCGEENPREVDYVRGEAYLFRDSIPQEMYHQIRAENPDDPDAICWIIFDSKAEDTYLKIKDFEIYGTKTTIAGTICNLPDYAKEWLNSQNGCKVYMEGIAYTNCGGITIGFHFEYLLTHLERR
jgi:hypothetical protein